ncbi:MAG: citrate synthase [Actinomycetota bacterium]|nr:citrate synthase [Actinomycetota bacterium]
MRRLTADEAAERLGIKKTTLYAYVSRGVLQSETAPDGRRSTFDAGEVETLARRGRRADAPASLDVVVVTELTRIEDHRLHYRGRDAIELARTARFEQVAEWLWRGAAADPWGRDLDPDGAVDGWRPRPGAVALARTVCNPIGRRTPADRLRVAIAALAAVDDLRFDLRPDAVADVGRSLLATLATTLRADGGSRGGVAADVAAALVPDDHERWVTPIERALVLLADHELATSTLAVRVAASTRADPYACLSAGLAAVSGPLHGSASTRAHRLLAEVDRPERATAVVGDQLRLDGRVPGVGHTLYPEGDPRAVELMACLAEVANDGPAAEIVDAVLAAVGQRTPTRPNIDLALAALALHAGMELGATEAIFSLARCAGWLAHAMEEYEEAPLRFRARAVPRG